MKTFLSKVKRPLVIVGSLSPQDRGPVQNFLARLQVPIYAEAPSGLRESPLLKNYLIHSSENILHDGHFDGVIRMGGVPTLRFWRDLEKKYINWPVLNLNSLPFSGLSRGVIEPINLSCLNEMDVEANKEDWKSFFDLDQKKYREVLNLLEEEKQSEASMIHQLSSLLPKKSRVYLGNSLPIREWDLAATRECREFEIGVSRGVNGIDGQLSTFYGWASPGQENWAILGDLTTLYDLAAPWILPQLPQISTHVVVINNKGGQFFSRLFESKLFLNEHQISFKDWARMWSFEYECWDAIPDKLAKKNGHQIIELLPDPEASQRFWKSYEAMWI